MTTTQVLRPTSTDRTFGTVSTSGGASAFSVVDDAGANDATYITSAQFGAGVDLGLGNLSALGGTQRVKRVKLRLRYFHNSADVGHQDAVHGHLRDNINGKLTKNAVFSTYSNTAVESSSGWFTADPNSAAWTESFITRMQVELAWPARGTGVDQCRVSEVYVDCEVDTQPTVTAVTVTGNTASTKPDFSFTYTTADDSGAQVRLQVKAFSLAQYSVAGFSPATSPNTWDSGVLSGSQTSGTVGADLAPNATYKVAVRAARDWPGPAGPLWWSDWSLSSAFTVTLTPPPTPTLSATVDATLPRYAVLLRVTSPINLLTAQQASGEDTTTGGWAAGANTTLTNGSTAPADGVRSFVMTSAAAGTVSAEMSARQRVKPGTAISAGATFRAGTTGRTVRVSVRFYTPAGTLISTLLGTSTTPTDASGSDVVAKAENITVPYNAYDAAVLVEALSTGAGAEVHRYDKIGLNPGATFAWSPGGYETGHSILLERRIAPPIGRGPLGNWLNPQLFSGGALQQSADGFFARNEASGDRVRQMPMDEPAPEGTAETSAGMIEWTINTGAFSYLQIGVPGTNLDTSPYVSHDAHPYAMPAPPGLAMTFELWMKAYAVTSGTPGGSYTCRLALIFTDAVNTQVGSTALTSNLTVGSTFAPFSVAATVPAGACFARLEVENTNGDTARGSRLYVAMPRWRRTAQTDDYPGQFWSWTWWEPVRQLTPIAVGDGETDLIVWDHEAAPDRPALYRATFVGLNPTGQSIASATSALAAVYMTPPTTVLIKDPWQPENAVVAHRAPGGTTGWDEDVTELHPMGRDGDPVFVRSWVSGDKGTLTVHLLNDLERHRLEQLIPLSRPLLIQWPEGGQSYARITAQSTERLGGVPERSTVTLAWTETARPA